MSTQVHVADTSTSQNEPPFSSTKFLYGDSSQLAQPPSVVVRARSTTEGIEMNFMGSSRTRQSEPSILEDDDVEPEVNTRKEWTAIASCCLCLFLSGWNDASVGPLLPTIQKYYNLNFTIISLLFVSACLGFMLAGVLNVHLSDRIGFGRVMLLGSFCQIASYSILVPAFPFPVMNIAYAINGFGIGLQDAQANGFVGALRTNASAKMGLIHSFYGNARTNLSHYMNLGAGALIAPVVATQFTHHPNWSFHYLAPLTMAAVNAVVIYRTFGFHTQEELLGPTPIDPAESASNERKYQQIFGSWGVQIMAAFCLLYVGAETTMGGWIVTFIVEERGGGTSAGYASSGFFGGLMLGRVILLWVNEKVGERRAVYAYVLLAIGLEMTVWMLPNLFGNAVAFALVGLLMGKPIYPIGMNVLGTIVPKWLLTGSMGWVASVGQAGGAVFPFITGTLTQKYGVQVLQPMLVALLGGIVISWALVPSSTKRRGD